MSKTKIGEINEIVPTNITNNLQSLYDRAQESVILLEVLNRQYILFSYALIEHKQVVDRSARTDILKYASARPKKPFAVFHHFILQYMNLLFTYLHDHSSMFALAVSQTTDTKLLETLTWETIPQVYLYFTFDFAVEKAEEFYESLSSISPQIFSRVVAPFFNFPLVAPYSDTVFDFLSTRMLKNNLTVPELIPLVLPSFAAFINRLPAPHLKLINHLIDNWVEKSIWELLIKVLVLPQLKIQWASFTAHVPSFPPLIEIKNGIKKLPPELYPPLSKVALSLFQMPHLFKVGSNPLHAHLLFTRNALSALVSTPIVYSDKLPKFKSDLEQCKANPHAPYYVDYYTKCLAPVDLSEFILFRTSEPQFDLFSLFNVDFAPKISTHIVEEVQDDDLICFDEEPTPSAPADDLICFSDDDVVDQEVGLPMTATAIELIDDYDTKPTISPEAEKFEEMIASWQMERELENAVVRAEFAVRAAAHPLGAKQTSFNFHDLILHKSLWKQLAEFSAPVAAKYYFCLTLVDANESDLLPKGWDKLERPFKTIVTAAQMIVSGDWATLDTKLRLLGLYKASSPFSARFEALMQAITLVEDIAGLDDLEPRNSLSQRIVVAHAANWILPTVLVTERFLLPHGQFLALFGDESVLKWRRFEDSFESLIGIDSQLHEAFRTLTHP